MNLKMYVCSVNTADTFQVFEMELKKLNYPFTKESNP